MRFSLSPRASETFVSTSLRWRSEKSSVLSPNMLKRALWAVRLSFMNKGFLIFDFSIALCATLFSQSNHPSLDLYRNQFVDFSVLLTSE